MHINFNPQFYRPSFGLIKLTPEDKDKSEELIKRINSSPIDSKEKDTFAMELYDVFDPYIEKEGRLKAKKSYVVEEVNSDIKIKFWEFINQVNSKKSLENLIEKIEKYEPRKTSVRPDYGREKSLDVPVRRGLKKTYKDNLTYDDLPVYLSPPTEEKVVGAKNEIEKTVNSSNLSEKRRIRLLKKSKGLSYSTIAKEEGGSPSNIRNSVLSSILKLQNDNNALSEKNKRHIENLAKELNISSVDIVHAILKNIGLLSLSSKIVRENIEKSSELFGVSKEEFIKAAIRQSSLFSQKPETLNRNMEISSKLLGIKKEEFIKAAMRQPSLFAQRPETLNRNTENSSKLLGIKKEEFVKAAIKRPNLFYQNPKTLNKNVETSCKLFRVSKEEFVKAAINQPNLFYQNPETLNKNIETSSKLLGVSKKKFIQAAIKCPSLICHKTETLNKHIETSSKLFGLPRRKFIQLAIKSPVLFCYSSETLYKKSKILNYYKKLQKKSDKDVIKISNICNNSLYEDILIFLLKKNYYPKLTRQKIGKNLPELLKNILNNSHKIEFEIPEDDVVQDFTAFCEKYSMKNFGENIFKIKTV